MVITLYVLRHFKKIITVVLDLPLEEVQKKAYFRVPSSIQNFFTYKDVVYYLLHSTQAKGHKEQLTRSKNSIRIIFFCQSCFRFEILTKY